MKKITRTVHLMHGVLPRRTSAANNKKAITGIFLGDLIVPERVYTELRKSDANLLHDIINSHEWRINLKDIN